MAKTNINLEKEVTKKMSIVEKTFGSWGKGPSGKEYVRKLRKESEERLKGRGI